MRARVRRPLPTRRLRSSPIDLAGTDRCGAHGRFGRPAVSPLQAVEETTSQDTAESRMWNDLVTGGFHFYQ